MVSLEELLQLLVQRGGSDLHIASGSPPRIRIDGKLMPTEFDTLTMTLKLYKHDETPQMPAGCHDRLIKVLQIEKMREKQPDVDPDPTKA